MNAFSGTVLLAGRTMPLVGRIHLAPMQLVVETADGGSVVLDAPALVLELGGSSRTMVFCRDAASRTTVMVDDPGFLVALAATTPALSPRIEELRGGLAKGRRVNRVLGVVLACLTALALALLAAVPWAADRAIGAIPKSVESQIGEAVAGQLGPTADDPVLASAVQRIVARLEPHAGGDGYRFRPRVLAQDDVNAFALPGGTMGVCVGLLEAAGSPEEVAGVIAHEMAHVTERHGLRSIVRDAGIAIAIQLFFGDVDEFFAYATHGATLAVINGYSRAQEREADERGVETLIAARVDPRGLARLFRTIERESVAMPSALAWLGTHPDTGERIAEVERLASRASGPWTPIDVDWNAVKTAIAARD